MSIPTLNEDLNILQNLEIPTFDEDMDEIQKLDDEPNDVGGLTATELKAKFDLAGNKIKTYLNETLIPSISETIAEAEEREKAEADRVLAEEQRVAAEQERAAAEAERKQAETSRQAEEADRAAAEAARKTAEDARVLAEQKRVDTDSGIVAQATSAAETAENAANKAVSAAIHQPIVGDNGDWFTWSFDAGDYVDTGIYAGGDAPYIGENGNWYVGQTDTGVSATSTGVYVGSGDMPDGYDLQIDPEGEETDFIPYIGSSGNWFVGNTDLGVAATGPAGQDGAPGPAGKDGSPGENGRDGVDGQAATFEIVNTETLEPGQPAAVTEAEGSTPQARKYKVSIPQGPEGPAGPALAVTNTAAVGQTIRVSAVDEAGQPTEWEAVDMTSGGGGGLEWELLFNVNLSENSAVAQQEFDSKYRELYGIVKIPRLDEKIKTTNQAAFLGANLYYQELGDTTYSYVVQCYSFKLSDDEWFPIFRMGTQAGKGTHTPIYTRSNIEYATFEARIIKFLFELPAGTTIHVWGRE